jgi:hypothetical protein
MRLIARLAQSMVALSIQKVSRRSKHSVLGGKLQRTAGRRRCPQSEYSCRNFGARNRFDRRGANEQPSRRLEKNAAKNSVSAILSTRPALGIAVALLRI